MTSDDLDDDQYYDLALQAGRLDVGRRKRRRTKARTAEIQASLPLDRPPPPYVAPPRPQLIPRTCYGPRPSRTVHPSYGPQQYLSDYLWWVRTRFAAAQAGMLVQIGWAGVPLDFSGFRREFVRALHRRITAKAGPEPNWRRLDSQYQADLVRDCRSVRDKVNRRVRLYSLSVDIMRQRFGHLIDGKDD